MTVGSLLAGGLGKMLRGRGAGKRAGESEEFGRACAGGHRGGTTNAGRLAPEGEAKMRIGIALAGLVFAAVPAAAQVSGGGSTAFIGEEFVLVIEPFATQPLMIAPQHFATEADCKALAAQLSAKTRCLKARIIRQPAAGLPQPQ